ncbi:hypothetical protein FQR65_LT17998 [Abscondita terminalis]|nr:hypothetical protein FQR65_LT17998 [Abscondita terminalis]
MQSNFDSQQTIQQLIQIVGQQHVLTQDHDTRLYRQGRRYGSGKVLAVVVPGTLFEQWQVLQAAVNADCIVILQAANTGVDCTADCGGIFIVLPMDIGREYGKDTFMFIEKLGTAKVPAAFAMKDKVDGYLEKIGLRNLSDKILQIVTKLLPNHLPKRMNEFRDLYEHHLMIRIENQDVEQVEAFLHDYFQQQSLGSFFALYGGRGRKAFLHRFAVAGAAQFRYRR